MNVQFAVQNADVYLIEVNPRASRTVPFVAKAIGRPMAKIAARVMAGEPLAGYWPDRSRYAYIAVRSSVFPFAPSRTRSSTAWRPSSPRHRPVGATPR